MFGPHWPVAAGQLEGWVGLVVGIGTGGGVGDTTGGGVGVVTGGVVGTAGPVHPLFGSRTVLTVELHPALVSSIPTQKKAPPLQG